MFRVLFAFSLIASAFGFTPSAHASPKITRGCEECPIPMNAWTGTWWNDASNLRMDIKKFPVAGSRSLRVTMRDTLTYRIVADGVGVLPPEGDVMTLRLRKSDGTTFEVTIEIEPENDRALVHLPSGIGSTLNGQEIQPDLYFVD